MNSIITSILDTDVYKITMAQAVLFGKFAGHAYQDIDVEYAFINRGKTKFPPGFAEALNDQVLSLSDLRLTSREHRWLREKCPYLKRAYLDFLRGFRFDASQVHITQTSGNLNIKIVGPWYQTIYYEVPLLAIISELYFDMMGHRPQNVTEIIEAKAKKIHEAGIIVSDFGTRRRRSFAVQDEIVRVLSKQAGPTFVGTSNPFLAMKHDVKAMGTLAHEFFSAHAALFGYRLANRYALNAWAEEFEGDLGTALTDTFTSPVFFSQFDRRMSKLFDGIRQDSGDPIEFAQQAITHYQKYRIDPLSKTIIFSDSLTIDKAIEIAKWCNGKIRCAFGIGTHLTNDCGCDPLNMVIKLVSCNGVPAVKLSDVDGKNTGDPEEIHNCKYTLGL